MGFLSRMWSRNKKAKKNEIYQISDIITFARAVDTVHITKNGKTSKIPFSDLELSNNDLLTCNGNGNEGFPSFSITIGEAWSKIEIKMSPSAYGEPSSYGLSKLKDEEKKKLTLPQRSLVH